MSAGRPAERIRKVEALVITHREYGEADRIIRLFTREYGKLTAIAKGVRKIHSRKAAHLEPFTHTALVLAYGQTFWIVSQADAINSYPAIRSDLTRTANAAYVLEMIDKVSSEGQAEGALFRLALETLARLEGQADAFNALRYFEFRFLDAAGFRPELSLCVACKREIQPQDQYYSVSQGGVLCPGCGVLDARAEKVRKDTLRYLRHFQRSTFVQVESVQVPPAVRLEMQRLMGGYVVHVLEWQLKTPNFMRQIHDRHSGTGTDDIQ